MGIARGGGEELTRINQGFFNSSIMVSKAQQCLGMCGCWDAPKEDHQRIPVNSRKISLQPAPFPTPGSSQSDFWEEGGCDQTCRVTWRPQCTSPALALAASASASNIKHSELDNPDRNHSQERAILKANPSLLSKPAKKKRLRGL